MASRSTPGLRVRHSRACRSLGGGKCSCEPSYEASVWLKRDQLKVRRTFSGRGARAEALSWLTDGRKAAKDGKLGRPNKQTVAAAAEEWLEKARRGEALTRSGRRYKPAVLREHERVLRSYVLRDLGDVRLVNLRRRDVQDLVDELVGKGMSGSTVRNVLMPLRVLCRRAIEDDEIAVNPTAHLRLPAAAGIRDRVATAEEAAALLDALPEDERALWATAFYAGLRRGELRGLQCDDIDTAAGVVHVRRGWDDVEGEIEPKSEKGFRDVPLSGTLRLILLGHMARTGRRGSDLVFGRTGSAPFTASRVRRRALRAWAAAVVGTFFRGERPGIELVPITLHELRHSYVSMMVDMGYPLERVGDYVGHSSTHMTNRYRHLLKGHEREAAERQDAYLAERGAQSGARLLAVGPEASG